MCVWGLEDDLINETVTKELTFAKHGDQSGGEGLVRMIKLQIDLPSYGHALHLHLHVGRLPSMGSRRPILRHPAAAGLVVQQLLPP